MKLFRWLYPGMYIKRWLFLFGIGLLLFALGIVLITNITIPVFIENFLAGLVHFFTRVKVSSTTIDIALILLGFIVMMLGLRQGFLSLYHAAVPFAERKLVDVIYEKQKLSQGLKIVTLGGGTGLSSLLRGLKKQTSNLLALVAVSDDGGSSGRLRKELGVLPPGDIRNCLVALADDESLLSSLLQHRFNYGNGLEGHNFGNLLLVALNQIAGDFEKAVELSGKILAIKGRVLPSTLERVTLCAEYTNGDIVEGESEIPLKMQPIKKIFLKPSFCQAPPDALSGLREADVIIFGPGSLYTSVLPHLLVKGVKEALIDSKAMKIYVCNVMTQPGETDNFKASDHLRVLLDYLSPVKIDYVLVNARLPEQKEMLQKYQEQNAYPVEADLRAIEQMGAIPLAVDIISEAPFLRHDPNALAENIFKLIVKNSGKTGHLQKIGLSKIPF